MATLQIRAKSAYGRNLLICLALLLLSFIAIKVLGFIGAGLLLMVPVAVGTLFYLSKRPEQCLWFCLVLAFFSPGLTRYVAGPWGLGLDILLVFCWLVLLMNKKIKVKWKHAKNDVVWLSLAWFGYLVLEIGNPAGNGPVAWFYAMRGIGFYQILCVPLVFILLRKQKHFHTFLNLLIISSLIGTFWGLKQQIIGLDSAENYWLFDLNHHEEHLLHGVLRVFSFYSDAGAFGASQAMMLLMCGILALGPFPLKKRLWYGLCAVLFLVGFGISGTRGALAVPLAGGIAYLVVNRNFRLLIAGFSAMAIVFCILKYTFLFQGVEQVRRMRTALDPENKSLSVRLDNQRIFGQYLANKPFGGGVGTAGFWGARFNPDSLMANTATDSWYVKIWAETGIFGLAFHLFILGYLLGKGGKTIMLLKNPKKKSYACALFAAFTGVVFASYGNQVFGQMPTGIIMNFAIPFLFIIPKWKGSMQSH